MLYTYFKEKLLGLRRVKITNIKSERYKPHFTYIFSLTF